jgi:hypothetical protein
VKLAVISKVTQNKKIFAVLIIVEDIRRYRKMNNTITPKNIISDQIMLV